MSMFHELMMRKKEEIMYATIKGSLTESPYGVFSGFSGTNYLALQHIIDFSKPFEILLKFTPTDFTTPLYLFSTRYNTNSGLDIYIQNSKIRIWGSTNGTSLDISSYSIDTININTTYWYKLKYSPTQIIAELSTDGINFVQENNIALSNQIYQNNYNALIGHGLIANTNYFVGSVDLPNSYIKLGATKYNLQAVVGYTIVGSPTITDGVVSGFSSANYLTIANSINAQDITEFVVKFKINSGATANAQIPIFNSSAIKVQSTTTASTAGFYYTQFLIAGFGFVQANSYLAFNSWHWIKYTNDGTTMRAFYSSDGITWTEGQNKSSVGISATGNFEIGKSNFETGEIDFNETYIKKKNKLWFNGQQA